MMKRTKFALCLVTLLLVGTLLPSCTNAPKTVTSWDSVLNPEYSEEFEEPKGLTYVSELDKYKVCEYVSRSTQNYIWLKGNGSWSDYKLYNSIQGKVTLSLSSEKYNYDLKELVPDLVQVTEYTPAMTHSEWNEYGEVTSYTVPAEFQSIAVYDIAGNELLRLDEEREVSAESYGDMILLEGEPYRFDETTGAYIKQEIPSYLMIPEDGGYLGLWNERYYYVHYYVNGNHTISVYDRDFQLQSLWSFPADAEQTSWDVLNDGNVLIQYRMMLPDDAKEFDFHYTYASRSQKYRLVTLLWDVETGKTKELRFPYVIANLKNRNQLTEQYGEDIFSDTLENVVYVCPIVDQQIDESDASRDLLLLSNEGKLGRSLKMVPGQRAVLPTQVGEDLYRVSMLTGGFAIVNEKGEILRMIQSTQHLIHVASGDEVYSYSKTMIYDRAFEEVYDLEANHAHVLETMSSAIFIQAEDPDTGDYKVFVISDGTTREIYSYDADGGQQKTLYTISYLGYALFDPQTGEYAYYTPSGKFIHTSKTRVYFVCGGNYPLYRGSEGVRFYIVT